MHDSVTNISMQFNASLTVLAMCRDPRPRTENTKYICRKVDIDKLEYILCTD